MPRTATAPCTVAEAMLRAPKLCGPATTVAQARALLRDEHVHALLVVDATAHGPVLRAVVAAADLAAGPGEVPVLGRGRLRGRVVGPDADLDRTARWMAAAGQRRLAVTDERGVVLGLLCRKRSGRGFCTDTTAS